MGALADSIELMSARLRCASVLAVFVFVVAGANYSFDIGFSCLAKLRVYKEQVKGVGSDLEQAQWYY